MLSEFRVLSDGCAKDVQLHPTPLHALIGPNDSGKSTLLRAIQRWSAQGRGPGLEGIAGPRGAWSLATYRPGPRHDASVVNAPPIIRFDPDALRQPSSLIPNHELLGFLNERGLGLPGVYDAILGSGDDSFSLIADDLRRLFPTVKNLRLQAVSANEKTLNLLLKDGTLIPAGQFSEGLLYYLAFAALPYIAGADLLLLEEPENGLHPSRIAEVIRMLRRITEENQTQIIMATHSPLVINELKPEEVTLITRHPETGTRATRMVDTKHFRERAEVYALGELWLSFANGQDEESLVGS